jgi:UDP-3-O-[3-hydroxymyristoyl] glucosamine N-acyltransferase
MLWRLGLILDGQLPEPMTTKTLKELAVICGATLDGDEDKVVTGPASLAEAGPTEVSFLANPRYAKEVSVTKAAAVIVGVDFDASVADLDILRCEDPNGAFTEVIKAFMTVECTVAAGVDESAVVDPTAEVHPEACVGALVYVGPRAQVGAAAVLHPNVTVEEGATVGGGTILQAGVHLLPGVTVGVRCALGAGTVIGSDGFGYDLVNGGWAKVPQCGTVVVEDDVEIGANVTIDRARFGATRIGRGAKLDNQVHVGHNSVVEKNAMLIAQVGLAGSCRVEEGAILAGRSGMTGHNTVGAGARVGGGSIVWSDVEPGADYLGTPARPKAEFMKTMALTRRLPKLVERIGLLETKMRELEGGEETL